MDISPDLLKKYGTPKSKARNEREELLTKFLERLNADRGKFKPITYARLAKLLKGKDLYPLYNDCDQANHFSKLFWHKIKNNK